MVYGGRPDAYKQELDIIRSATPAQVKDAAQRWLSDGVYVLQIDPYPSDLKATGTGVDRKKLAEGGAAPAVVWPKVEKGDAVERDEDPARRAACDSRRRLQSDDGRRVQRRSGRHSRHRQLSRWA